MNPERSERSRVLGIPAVLLGALLFSACGDSGRQPPALADSTIPAAPAPDSMLLTLADSTGVWLVAGRTDTSSSGAVCTERLLELRRGDRRLPVPLLYTIGMPKVLNDSTLRAALYRRCEVQAWYRVDLRTGLPKPERES